MFPSLYFCVYVSDGTPSENYFSDGIRIVLCVFAHTEQFEFLVQSKLSMIFHGKCVHIRAAQNFKSWSTLKSQYVSSYLLASRKGHPSH